MIPRSLAVLRNKRIPSSVNASVSLSWNVLCTDADTEIRFQEQKAY